MIIVDETKTRVSAAIIEHVMKRVREAMRAFSDKFPGKVVIVVYRREPCQTPWRKSKN